MAEVNVEINGRKYRMACEDGQESHLSALAGRFNGFIETYKGAFGEIGDNRLTVMAGIAVLDELAEAEKRIAALEKELDEVARAGHVLANRSEDMEARFVAKLNDVARKIETVAVSIDRAGQGGEAGGA